MSDFPRSAVLEKSLIVFVDPLKHQLLELEALRKELVEAERRVKRLAMERQLARCRRLFAKHPDGHIAKHLRNLERNLLENSEPV